MSIHKEQGRNSENQIEFHHIRVGTLRIIGQIYAAKKLLTFSCKDLSNYLITPLTNFLGAAANLAGSDIDYPDHLWPNLSGRRPSGYLKDNCGKN